MVAVLRVSSMAIAILTIAGSLGSRDVSAGNGGRPRTPPVMDQRHCLVEIDRSVDPNWGFHYGLPLEDVEVGDDELPDSRTHQFFALCRDGAPADPVPIWASMEDAERAEMAGIVLAVPADDVILDRAPGWQVGHDGISGSCVHPITTVAERRPIACASAQDPVRWDTTGLPPGSYVVMAHTFEPLPNLWTPRAGVVRIHDGDPDAAGPGVGLLSPGVDRPVAFDQTGYTIAGCAAGAPGTTVTLEWTREANPAVWTAVAAFEVDPESCGFEVLWRPPAEAVGSEISIRATATDPFDRSFRIHAPGTVTVLAGDGPSPPPDPPAFADICGGSGESDPSPASCEAGAGTGTGTGNGTGEAETGSSSGAGTAGTDGSTTGSSDSGGGDTLPEDTGPEGTTLATTGSGSVSGSTAGSDDAGTGTGTKTNGCACDMEGRAPRPDWILVFTTLLLLPTLTKDRNRAI